MVWLDVSLLRRLWRDVLRDRQYPLSPEERDSEYPL